jgi:addiction module HigA family antidote
MADLAPVHPGEILKEDYLEPLGISAHRLAMELHVPATRIGDIVNCRRSITADTAIRLARYFNTSAQFWMNLQNQYDLEVAQDESGAEVERDVHPLAMRA